MHEMEERFSGVNTIKEKSFVILVVQKFNLNNMQSLNLHWSIVTKDYYLIIYIFALLYILEQKIQ